jgi:hypothetical protein
MLKSSQAISRVNVDLKTNVSEISIIRMTETEMIFKTSIFNSTLTWLIAQDDYSTRSSKSKRVKNEDV